MNYLKRKLQSSESGVTLILALMMVAAVGLLVVPLMLIGASSLRATNFSEQRFNERYSVDAGVEDALWKIKYDGGFNPDGSYDYDKTFNDLVTNIIIEPSVEPANQSAPAPQVRKPGSAITGYKTVNRHLVQPCLTAPCAELFEYTLTIENYGGSTVHMDVLADCLPVGFLFKDVLDVSGFGHPSFGDFVIGDLLPDGGVTPGVEYFDLPVGSDPDDPTKKPNVSLSVVNNDTNPTCLSDDPSTEDRWQVKWDFLSPQADVDPGSRAEIKMLVEGRDLDRGIYYNEMWWVSDPNSLGGNFTCGTSPVYALFDEWDITSSARGSMVNARATMLENSPLQPITILSWQVGGETATFSSPIPTGTHVEKLCGMAEPDGSGWNTVIGVTVYDSDGNPVADAQVTGTWSFSGSGKSTTCTTDGTGKCADKKLESGRLDFAITATTFKVDSITHPTLSYLPAYNKIQVYTINQPGLTSPPDTTPPAAPTGLITTAGDGLVSLDWADNSEPDLAVYNVSRSATTSGPYTQIATVAAGASAYTDTTVINGTAYFYVVTAADTFVNESGYSNEASATPQDLPPAAPTGLIATAGDGLVSLDWADNSEPDLDGYNVSRSTTTGGPYAQIATGVVASAYTDTTVINGTAYFYVVTAVDTLVNESGYSSEASATPAPVPPLAITTASLPDGTEGTPYSFTLAATGGTAPYQWSKVGKLPGGLKLDADTGEISGNKPNKTGMFTFDVEVTDSSGPVQSVIQAFSITILP